MTGSADRRNASFFFRYLKEGDVVDGRDGDAVLGVRQLSADLADLPRRFGRRQTVRAGHDADLAALQSAN